MGQGPSSIDYNYVYKDKGNTVASIKNKNKNTLYNKEEINKINSMFNELLNVLKYHTNMYSIDKNFVLKNKLINNELDKKIISLKKEINKNDSSYLTLSEQLRQYKRI